jgi:hypothetical protein
MANAEGTVADGTDARESRGYSREIEWGKSE